MGASGHYSFNYSCASVFRSYPRGGRSVREGVGLGVMGVDLFCGLMSNRMSEADGGPVTRVHAHTWRVNRKVGGLLFGEMPHSLKQ